ncbi:hypothetical protein GQR36_21945 [Enterococcus termitis]
MPTNALLIQGGLISLFILGISFGSHYVVFLYNQLTLMTNISRAIPYLLVALAYPAFKKQSLNDPSSHSIRSHFISYSVIFSIILAISFQLYQPISKGEVMQSISLLIGPMLFTLIAYLLYKSFQFKQDPYTLDSHKKTGIAFHYACFSVPALFETFSKFLYKCKI